MTPVITPEPCIQPSLSKTPAIADLRAGNSLDAETFSALRRRAMLEGCKWDIQVGDSTTLAPFPLVMNGTLWHELAQQAEQLAAETAAAEKEIINRPELLRLLGMPPALLNTLASNAPLTPAAGHVIRFDFHPTTDGWRISEANSDVPGGFTEASHFTAMMAAHFPCLATAGNPGEAWCDTLAAAAGAGAQVALLSAPGILSDHQVIAFLATELNARGCHTHLAKPEQIRWHDGVAHLETGWHCGPIDLVVRFYQAEWLPRWSKANGWQHFFRGGKTLVTNPPLAVISESKRFPLTWEHLSTQLSAWRQLLPAVRDPRQITWFNDQNWLLKTAYCNTGEAVSIRQLMKPHQWWRSKIWSRLAPGKWVAQQRFESVPVPTPVGPRHACVGIYSVDGKAAGAYARLSEKPLIDYAAMDVALLIDENE
jgi:hypothetical protein